MERGEISVSELSGGIDLTTTLESGQTYLWRRSDGEMYQEPPSEGCWYSTVHDEEVIRIRQQDDILEWQGTDDVVPQIKELLRLEDDLPAILRTAPEDSLINTALEYATGLRIVNDAAFGSTISFICSAQMRVSRIHRMVSALAETYGSEYTLNGETYYAFPTPEQLASASVNELRDLKLGYRAPYVKETAQMVADDVAHPAKAETMSYESARSYLTQFTGVGDKVADCVLLFSLGFLEAVPLDTWIRTAIEDHYPACATGSYASTSQAIREQFGGTYAGYIQTYVFHYLRNNG
ncbi:8-oxoguanine DNA glycosylase [Salinarchaeum sp. IM2453]|uniref:DNA-3-methyladenine glycosylase family protein n=1 Tax=Salinarchaeum sp. IM2453 TaxID=2862870 RepID=UPI001C82ADBF|nr:DNA glycosylase [Salinarchaeum sp. IM2453]QZA89800.1 8-oxoguanine DNA glycosylase [Salinarchaeum sp. IM2453]